MQQWTNLDISMRLESMRGCTDSSDKEQETKLAQRQNLFLLKNLPLELHSASTSSVSGLGSPRCSASPSTSKSPTKAAATKEPSGHSKRLRVELPFFSPRGAPRTEHGCIQMQYEHPTASKSVRKLQAPCVELKHNWAGIWQCQLLACVSYFYMEN